MCFNIGQTAISNEVTQFHEKESHRFSKGAVSSLKRLLWDSELQLTRANALLGNIVNNSAVNSSDISFDESDSDSSNSLSDSSDSEDA